MYPLQSFFRKLLLTLFSLLITFIVLLGFAYLYLDSQLQDVQTLKSVQLPIPLRVYTNDGQLIAEFGELHRNPIPLNQVPPILIKAILATEDQRFYEHPGVDMYGLLRAVNQMISTGTKGQGGSTITMQVARNFYLTRKKTFIRKIVEIMLALKIEREFSKDQILELYLNKIYLGNRAYGVAAAAQVYYGKSLNELTLPELAMIAGLPKAPSTINPIADPAAALDRRDHVLERMHELGYIDKKTYEAAVKTPLTAGYHGEVIPVHAPYVAEMVRSMLVTSFGNEAYTKGFNVYTTINSKDQLAANQALRNALMAYDQRHGYRGPEGNLGIADSSKAQKQTGVLMHIPIVNGLEPALVMDVTDSSIKAMLRTGEQITIPWSGIVWAKPQLKSGWAGAAPRSPSDVVEQGDVIRVDKQPDGSWALSQIPKVEGAFVALNPNNGAIQALVGGFDFQRSKYNRAVQMQRQPGSGFKPFVYASGLARGFTLASVFNDAPISFNIPGQAVWRPQNDDHVFHGPTRLRVALAHSVNVVSVRLLQAVGVPFAIKFITRFGFDEKQLPRNLSLALGTADVTPLQLVRGYAVFANGGFRITPYIIDHITDTHGQLLYQSSPQVACNSCEIENDPRPKTATNSDGNHYAPLAIPPQIAYLMTSALQDVIHFGTGKSALVLKRGDIAGKTGTTSEWVDTWFNGFNSDIVATAWVGFDQPSSLHEYGAQVALPMWIDFMRVALEGTPEHTMEEPPGITSTNIDPITGYKHTGGMSEYFRDDEVPQEESGPDNSKGNTDTNNNPVDSTNNPDLGNTQSKDSTESTDSNDDDDNNSQDEGEPLF